MPRIKREPLFPMPPPIVLPEFIEPEVVKPDPSTFRPAVLVPAPVRGEYARIRLSGAGGTHRALIDKSEYRRLSKWKWYASVRPDGSVYAISKAGPMHRVILGLSKGDGLCADHINHDTLDNRRANLRVATRTENARNKRGFREIKGISRVGFRWRARIGVDGKHIHLGMFDTEAEAHSAYVEGAKKCHGEFAHF